MKISSPKLAILLFCVLAAGVALGAPARQAAYPDGLYAELQTNKGTIVLQLEYEKTPMTVSNFVGLAEGAIENKALPMGTPYFDGTVFHRVVPGHVIQAGRPGSPQATETGPGYTFPNEIDASLSHERAGMLGMANGGPHTNSSQFYVTLGDRSYLDGNYTVFGHVVRGMDVVNSIVQGDVIEKVRIVRAGRAAAAFTANTASFQRLAEAARTRVKEADERKDREETAQIAKQWPNAVTSAKGAQYVVTREGSGEAPQTGSTLRSSTPAAFLDGRPFDHVGYHLKSAESARMGAGFFSLLC